MEGHINKIKYNDRKDLLYKWKKVITILEKCLFLSSNIEQKTTCAKSILTDFHFKKPGSLLKLHADSALIEQLSNI